MQRTEQEWVDKARLRLESIQRLLWADEINEGWMRSAGKQSAAIRSLLADACRVFDGATHEELP
jgi:hypothetical protein